MSRERSGFKFRMELACEEEVAIRQLHDFGEFAVGAVAGESHTAFFQLPAINIIEFISMAVAFGDVQSSVSLGSG